MGKSDKRREQIEKRLPDLNQRKAVCGVCGGVEEGDAWTAMGHATFYHFPVSKCVDHLKGQIAALKAEHAAELSRQVTQFQKVLDAAKEDGERFQAESQAAKDACKFLSEGSDIGYIFFNGANVLILDLLDEDTILANEHYEGHDGAFGAFIKVVGKLIEEQEEVDEYE